MQKYYEKDEWYHLLPIMFIITIVPLIVFLRIVHLSGDTFNLWNGAQDSFDFFSYYKMVWFITGTVFALMMLAVKYFQSGAETIRKSYYYIPMAVYSAFVILSTVLSKYPEIAKSGFVERYEGMYVIIGYMLILFITMNLVKKEMHVKVILGSLFASAIILGFIGLFQYIGWDLWKTNFGKSIMIPNDAKQYSKDLTFLFGKHMIYGTLYHADYVGSYMAMLMPLTLAIFILTKNKIFKIFMAFLTLLMAINWFGCNSRAGMVGGFIAIIIFLIMINKYIIKHWKYFLVGLVFIVAIFGVLNAISKGAMGARVMSLIKDATKIVDKSEVKQENTEQLPLKDIKTYGNTAEVVTPTETIKIVSKVVNNNPSTEFKDKDNNNIRMTYDQASGKVNIEDPTYKDYDIHVGALNGKRIVQIVKGSINLYFDVSTESVKLIDNKQNVVDLGTVEKWGFEGKERLGSSRGYIWSRSIPLLKDTVIFGHGPDTFIAYFPQNDLLGKMYAYYGDMWQLVDKPHDMYLQVALNTGVISLVAFLAIFIMYFVKSVKIYFRNDYDNFTSIAGLAIFIAICGYLGAAFFNDSIVSVAPVFWILLGVGISIDYMLSGKDKEKLKTR